MRFDNHILEKKPQFLDVIVTMVEPFPDMTCFICGVAVLDAASNGPQEQGKDSRLRRYFLVMNVIECQSSPSLRLLVLWTYTWMRSFSVKNLSRS